MSEEPKCEDLTTLNDALLEPTKEERAEPKRNTKDSLIERILSIAEENNLELTFSNTKLKRMNKRELGKLLGELTEEVIRQQMATSVGAKGTSEKAIGIATLRMCHDMMAMACENGLNQCLPQYGYRIDGFCETLKNPTVSDCVDECLVEIAATTDVLQYIESPYARLGIAWAGALATTVRPVRRREKPPPNQRDVRFANVGPQPPHTAQTVQRGPRRRPQAREEHGAAGPAPAHELRV